MAETISADEQKKLDEEAKAKAADTAIADEADDDTDDDFDEEIVDVNALQAELAKEKAEREKRENRYRSSKKKEATQPTNQDKNQNKVDVESIVEKQLTVIQEKKDFIAKYGDDVFIEIKKIKDKHPTLSLEEAYKISPIASDQPSKENPQSLSMGGRANEAAIMNSKVITLEQYVALPQVQYRLMKEKIAKGEVILKK